MIDVGSGDRWRGRGMLAPRSWTVVLPTLWDLLSRDTSGSMVPPGTPPRCHFLSVFFDGWAGEGGGCG